MNKNIVLNILYAAVIALVLVFMLSPLTKDIFNELTTNHPFLMAYGKFFILASMGELLGVRIQLNRWKLPQGFVYKALLWGVYGMTITLGMKIFSLGIAETLETGYLPINNGVFIKAFLTSLIFNSIFSPVFMTAHKFIDTKVDFAVEGFKGPCLQDLIERIDWETHYGFVVMKTIPFFWIPVHTVVFMMPENYRVVSAAFLSIVLGMILAISKKNSEKNNQNAKNKRNGA
jgi:hypothetical protein